MNGRPLNLTWADENIPAILETWHLGTQSGNAIAQVLYGDYNPSGKLTMSFPRNVGQVPLYYNYKKTGRPGASSAEVTKSPGPLDETCKFSISPKSLIKDFDAFIQALYIMLNLGELILIFNYFFSHILNFWSQLLFYLHFL